MKKNLPLIAILFSLSVKGQTNVYHPFPDSDAVWNINMIANCAPRGWEFDYYSVRISGDTILNSEVYHKLSISFIQHSATDFCSEALGYQGAIRQDTSLKKVFYFPPTDTIEHLLYDFNMQVGDTVRGFLHSYQNDDVVQSIDSVLVGGNYRKRWNINPGYHISLIDGIGSTYGLIQASPGTTIDLPDYSITCFSQNGITLYPDTSTHCELIDNTKENSTNIYFASISPNPFHSTALLQVGSAFETACLKVYNPSGSIVMEKRLSNQKSFVLNRAELHNGIYFLQLINDTGQMTIGKLVVE